MLMLLALPLSYCPIRFLWPGRRDLNPRPGNISVNCQLINNGNGIKLLGQNDKAIGVFMIRLTLTLTQTVITLH